MPKRFHKHRLLLDENMSGRQELPRLNHHFNVKHVRDLNQQGASDPAVYALALTLGRIIVTANGRHFRLLVTVDSPGIIDFPADWSDPIPRVARSVDLRLGC
jgi:predicted nuclease of predicted toxin-antitoxin system